MKSLTKYPFLILLSLGLIIRLLLAFLPGQVFDMKYWFDWSLRLNQNEPSQFYTHLIRTDYTPGYLYILYGLGFLKTTFNINDDWFLYILKMPGVFAEIMLAVVVYFILIKITKPKLAIVGLSAVLFNPLFIFNSAVWGQIDGLLSLTLLLAIYFMKNKSFILASITLAVATLIKPQTISILPVFILYIFRNLNPYNLIKLTLPFFITVFIFSFPFFPNQPLMGLVNLIINTANEYSYTSLNAYNFWGIIGFWITDNIKWNNFSYQTWGQILLISYWAIMGYYYLKKKLSIYALATLTTLGFFFLPTRVHERYLYSAIVFLIILSLHLKSRLLITLTTILSGVSFLNLYFVYITYNGLPRNIFYNLLAENSKSLSLIFTLIFILISATIVKYVSRCPKEN